MSKYYLKPVATDMFNITLNRAVVGFVRKVRQGEFAGLFIGKIGDVIEYRHSAEWAFDAAVRGMNRIALCGENDEMKAREVLAERNAEVRKEVAELNALVGMQIAKVAKSKVAI